MGGAPPTPSFGQSQGGGGLDGPIQFISTPDGALTAELILVENAPTHRLTTHRVHRVFVIVTNPQT